MFGEDARGERFAVSRGEIVSLIFGSSAVAAISALSDKLICSLKGAASLAKFDAVGDDGVELFFNESPGRVYIGQRSMGGHATPAPGLFLQRCDRQQCDAASAKRQRQGRPRDRCGEGGGKLLIDCTR